MTATILTAPAGSGKTDIVIREILFAGREEFGREMWVLLPTRLQIDSFRQRLLQQAAADGWEAFFNVRLFNFYELYDYLLDLAGSPQRTILQSASDRILREVIRDLNQQKALAYYHQIAHTPGFANLVSHFIKELKQGEVRLDKFNHALESPKDYDLALIYEHYQEFLQEHELADRDGAGWVALLEVQKDPNLIQEVGLLLIDGYDQFTPLQARLLAALSQSVQETILTLTYEEHRREDACRVFDRTLDRLKNAGQWQIVQSKGFQPVANPRPFPLAHLEKNLFALNAYSMPAGDHLHLIEAPDPRQEAGAVMRNVKNLLLNGVSPESILVVVRDSAGYAEPLRTAAFSYGIPALIRQQTPVIENPAVATVLQLLDLHQQDFPRRAMLDLLRNPYLNPPDFSPEDGLLLERVSLERVIVGGCAGWLESLENIPVHRDDDDFDRTDPLPDLAPLRGQVERFFERITPPEKNTARRYVAWIEALLGQDPDYALTSPLDPLSASGEGVGGEVESFRIYEQVRQGDSAITVRDVYALHCFRAVLQEVMAAYDLLAETRNQGEALQIEWAEFRADLEVALKPRTVMTSEDAGSRLGKVLITTVFEARGLSHDHVFILGLAEGVFPAQQHEDPLYSDRERVAMEKRGIDIQNPAERIKDAGLFYEMCALARLTLTLSRPTVDDSGNLWSESAYWKNVTKLLEDASIQRIRPGEAPSLNGAGNLREVMVSLSRELNQSYEQVDPLAWGVTRWLGSNWRNLLTGREMERNRESRYSPFDRYSGILSDPALIEQAAHYLSANRVWSATQFNELGQCAFRFFSKRLLSLEKYEEPEEGLNVMQLGTVNHAILERTYQRMADAQLPFDPENLALAMDILSEEADVVFATAPQEYGFRVTPLWGQEKRNLLAKLKKLIQLDFSPENPYKKLDFSRRVPFQMETGFDGKANDFLEMEGAAGTLKARGYIDRIDLIDDQYIVLLDYKSGGIPNTKDILEGHNFQMTLYLLAVNQLLQRWNLPYQVGGGVFWSIQSGKSSPIIALEGLEAALDRLHQIINEGRRGKFPTIAGKLTDGKCAHYCEFSQLCRMNHANSHKPMPE